MSFTSYEFLIFFILLFSAYWTCRSRKWRKMLLLAASYYFYGAIQIWYALLLGISTVFDYFLALRMVSRPGHKRLWMWLSLLLNIGVLAFFKHYNFFGDEIISFIRNIGFKVDPRFVSIALPAGLSFFTLKKLSYMIDVSRGALKPTHSFIDFALFVSFFPQLISGPIDRAQKLLPQIETDHTWSMDLFHKAWPLVVMGLFKKLVIAASIQVVVDKIFGLANPSAFLLLCGALGYTVQILADFSAYTDLARGIAYLFGFDTSENFRQPYLSLTPTDFWNRWHITLSTWLRDYIFFPLRRSLLRYNLNEKLSMSIPPIITMFVSGIWHGAGSNFVVWGLYYGVLIAFYQLIGIRGNWKPQTKLGYITSWGIMFFLIVVGWAIFRAPSLDWLAGILLHKSFIWDQDELIFGMITLTMTLACSLPLIIKYWIDQHWPGGWLQAVYYVFVLMLTIIYINSASSDFIYFQF